MKVRSEEACCSAEGWGRRERTFARLRGIRLSILEGKFSHSSVALLVV